VSELEAEPPTPLLRLPSIEAVVALRGAAGNMPPLVAERLGTGWNWEKAGGSGAERGGGKAPWFGRFCCWNWGSSELGALMGGMGTGMGRMRPLEPLAEPRNCCTNCCWLFICGGGGGANC
jgi:hypothetical protein